MNELETKYLHETIMFFKSSPGMILNFLQIISTNFRDKHGMKNKIKADKYPFPVCLKHGFRIANFLFLMFLFSTSIFSQSNGVQNKIITINTDTIQIDTLFLIPSSVKIYLSDTIEMNKNYFAILSSRGNVFIDTNGLTGKQIRIQYRTFPRDYFKTVDLEFFKEYQEDYPTPEKAFFTNKTEEKETLFKKGTISRGISLGNNQDMSVASNLNLQLAGKLSEEFEIKASITDNNIPVQPEGNTQQIQDFDRIFIQLIHKNGSLTAGDFEMKSPNSNFLRYYKKVQGALLETDFLLKDSLLQLKTYSGAALSKGKYNRFKIIPVEGNQGPYKLQGANSESYIVILAGTEKVYIDGKLLIRGFSNDYVIDYNTAELTFTPSILITKDKRIEVEFEYTDRNYARVTANGGIELKSKKWTFATDFFIENDLKNQSIDQDLTDDQKSLLSQIGDNLAEAVSYKVDSVSYSNDKVLYKMIDSLGYDSVFVYSTHPDSAHYQLGFSLVGQGKGNYVQIKSSANGRVFEWVAPLNGQPGGNYEPVILLVSPKKSQMYSFRTSWFPNSKTEVFSELAISNKDLNLFSEKNNSDNTGFAATAGFKKKTDFKTGKLDWQLYSEYSYLFQQKDFEVIERYRPVEFLRDWNLSAEPVKKDQQLHNFHLRLQNKTLGNISYAFSNFSMPEYRAVRQASRFSVNPFQSNNINGEISLTNSDLLNTEARFLKHKLAIVQQIPYLIINLNEETENIVFKDKITNYRMKTSSAFTRYGVLIQNNDKLKNNFQVQYNHRIDYLIKSNDFAKSTSADEIEAQYQLVASKTNTLKVQLNLRKLEINDTSLSVLKPDLTSLGKIEHNLILYKSAISAFTFFQAGTSMEVKKDFSYLEVTPGQGIYAWNDYNQNGIKELDEFEISAFQDKANYIRVFIPTNEYIKTFSNSFSTTINLNPSRYFGSNSKGFSKFISRFSNQLIYKVDNKNTFEFAEDAYNPFYANINTNEILSLNGQFREVLFFNKSNPIFNAEVSYKAQQVKSLLTNGADKNSINQSDVKLRWGFLPSWQYRVEAGNGIKIFDSEYFISKNYFISYQQILNELIWQPGKTYRISFQYEYRTKRNDRLKLPDERSQQHIFGLESKYNFIKEGSISGRLSLLNLSYNAASNSQLAYEMLGGLMPGKNITWNIIYQRTILSNLQLSILYDGRKSETLNTIHVGSIQLRAFF